MIQQSSAQLKGLEKTCEFEVGVGAVPQDTTLSYPAGGSNLLMFKGPQRRRREGWLGVLKVHDQHRKCSTLGKWYRISSYQTELHRL